MLPQEPYKKFAVITLYVAVAMGVIYLIFNYLWGALLPFVIAYIFAEFFRPVVRYSEKHEKFPKRIFVLSVVILATGAIIMLIYAITRQLVLELTSLTAAAKEMFSLMSEDDGYAREMIERINSLIPFVDVRQPLWDMRHDLWNRLWGVIVSFGEGLSGNLISIISNAAAFVPNLIFTTIVVILATYYIAVDRVKVNCFLLSLFPKNIRKLLKYAKDILVNTVGKYIRAYTLLFLITFAELLLIFSVLKVEYSFVLALVIALVDILPVLGTGTALIPWGIASLFMGNYFLGIGLLVGYGIIVVVRQVVEPKIIGKFIGLPPLATLASMFIGLKLMGFAGIFIFPIGAMILKRILEIRDEVIAENEEKSQMQKERAVAK